MRCLQLSKTFTRCFSDINMHEYVPHTLQFWTGNRGRSVIVTVYMDCGKKSKKSRELVEIMPSDDWKGLKKGARKRGVHRFSKGGGKDTQAREQKRKMDRRGGEGE